jgi:F-type H+-transporting ATPase subunit delta
MTDNRLLATRYASALFDKAAAEKALDAVQADLAQLARFAAESQEFGRFLTSPLVQTHAAERALGAILKRINAHAITGQFVLLLAENRRLGLLPVVSERFGEMLLESRGELVAEVESAAPVDDATQQKISAALAKSTGKKVHLKLRQNAGLLGGLIVYFSGKRLDLSLAGQLDRLQHALHQA